MNITNLMLRFTAVGAEWVLWLLVGLSFLSIALIIETRAVLSSPRSRHRPACCQTRGGLACWRLGAGAASCAWLAFDRKRGPSRGLERSSAGLARGQRNAAKRQGRERLKLEAYLPVLGTLGNNAPFIGLLGTVIGIIRASTELAQAPAAKHAASTAVMSSVFEALVATAVGLFVAIPAVVAFNVFQRKARSCAPSGRRFGTPAAVVHEE